jgi:hypothetical protein
MPNLPGKESFDAIIFNEAGLQAAVEDRREKRGLVRTDFPAEASDKNSPAACNRSRRNTTAGSGAGPPSAQGLGRVVRHQFGIT